VPTIVPYTSYFQDTK